MKSERPTERDLTERDLVSEALNHLAPEPRSDDASVRRERAAALAVWRQFVDESCASPQGILEARRRSSLRMQRTARRVARIQWTMVAAATSLLVLFLTSRLELESLLTGSRTFFASGDAGLASSAPGAAFLLVTATLVAVLLQRVHQALTG